MRNNEIHFTGRNILGIDANRVGQRRKLGEIVQGNKIKQPEQLKRVRDKRRHLK